MKNIYLQLIDLYANNPHLALAAVTRSKGSSPQKPGSSAIFGKEGLISGTVGGGIVEGRVTALAKEAIRSKKSGHFLFNLSNDISKQDEAICGGEISVLIDPNLNNSIDVFKAMRDSVISNKPGVLITMVTPFAEDNFLINRYWINEISDSPLPEPFMDKLKPVLTEMMSKRNAPDFRETKLSIPDEEPSSVLFLEAVFPPEKLVIAGAGHIGKAVAHLGSMLDFEITVIDDRNEFANKENIPDADHFIVDNIGDSIERLKKDKDTFVVIVTRGHKDDAAALRPCIGSELAYTGMIGSRTKTAAIRAEFIKKGWATTGQWESIYTPIGIDIKSQTVAEIAVSISAQLVLVRNQRKNKN